jgi:PAS domain S-box-containing protein
MVDVFTLWKSALRSTEEKRNAVYNGYNDVIRMLPSVMLPPSRNSPATDTSAASSPKIMKGRFLPQLLSGLVLGLSLLITYQVWNNAQQAAKKDLQTSFDFRVRETVESIGQRMATYEQVLRGAQGFWRGPTEVTRDDFHFYVAALRLEENYPGIQGLGISRIVPKAQKDQHVAAMRRQGFPDYAIHPDGDRETYTSITQIEPFTGLNLRAHGFDMFSRPIRRAAMERARDTGKAALSGKVTLVQEVEGNVQPGFLMYLPLFQPEMPTNTVEERRAGILGWVYAPFRMNDLMAGLGGERSADLRIRIFDGEAMSDQKQLYDSAGGSADGTVKSPLFATTQRVNIAGHPWTLAIHSEPGFESRINTGKSPFIAIAGIGVSVLLALLVWLLATGRKRAVQFAMKMTHEIKQNEDALRESHARIAAEQQRMKVILENSHDAFVAIDTNDLITDWNIQAERTFGWTAEEAIGQRLADLIIPEDQRQAHTAGFHRFTSTGTGPVVNNRVEVVARHRSGKSIPVELAVAAVRHGTGYIANAFIRDISERKEAQRLEAERSRSLEEARRALQHSQKLEAVGKLTGGVAHDFNNVLQIIAGNLQLLQMHFGGNEQVEKRLNSALSGVERGAKLSSQLLAFARRQPLQPLVVNLQRLVNDMDDLLRQALGESIGIETIIAEGLWNTLVDPHQMENVILNLAINSRDAMEGGGRLTIELGNTTLDDDYVSSYPDVPAGQYVVLAISDTGSGMTAEVMEQAFEPFFTTKPEGQGTGLGLSMTYGFVKQSGGHVQIYSEVGHGTTLRIYLPRSVGPEADMPMSSTGALTGGSETILVVEDDLNVQATVVAMLTELGYRVIKADDGESALNIIKSGVSIDLLFTDVVMPESLRGPELAKAVKEIIPDIAVLFTSGYTQNAMGQGGRLDPDVNLLSKPYRREQLARKVRQSLSS